MRVKLTATVLVGVSLITLVGCQKAANTAADTGQAAVNAAEGATAAVTGGGAKLLSANATDAEKIDSAMTAAPKAIAEAATIVDMGPSGMRTLRQGTNNFTCMADSPTTPGPDPMCGDTNGMAFIDAWVNKKTPANKPGILYMLEGGTDASNTDPYATAPTAANNWIKTGPHMMLVGAPDSLKGYPTDANPDTSKPYVMWPGTPYAHLMIPVR